MPSVTPPFKGNINFNAQHAPMDAFMSFTLGHFGTAGGIGAEIGKPASQNIFIGVKDGDRLSNAPLRCLPFYRGALHAVAERSAASDSANASNASGAASFLVEQAGPAEQNVKPNVTPLQPEQIQRAYGWATDRWTTDDLEFAIYTPFSSIPDPSSATHEDLRDALVPAVIAELIIDNSAGTEPKTAVFAIGFDTPGVHKIDRSGPESATIFAWRNKLGFAGKLVEEGELLPIQRWDVSEAIRDANPVHQLGTCAGFAFEVPPGERRTLRLAIGCYLEGIVTTGIEGRYLYTHYFSSLIDVLDFELDEDRFVERRSVARTLDRQLVASNLSSDQQFLIAHGTRSYYGSTQLLEVAGEPFWVVNEGEYCMMNTLDLSIDHAFWELDQNPWVVRNLLDSFVRHYSYVDEVKLDREDPTQLAPGGMSFAHDMGAHNNFSRHGTSSYELPHLKGCFSYMTQEQLCNWILLAGCYIAKTGDHEWLRDNAHVLDACAASMRARADEKTGLMTRDSSRCDEGWEITTYDSLDESLGQARASAYLATKCWASWIALEMMGQIRGVHSDVTSDFATNLARHLIGSTQADGTLRGVLEADSPGFESRVLPAIESLIYPQYWLTCLEARSADTPAQTMLLQWLRHPLIAMLRGHAIQLLRDPQSRNIFPDGGIRLSSTSDNSWMSKIAIAQHVAREILHLDHDAIIRSILSRADAAHVRWQTDGGGYWACSDQFVKGFAKGSRYYPRIITAALWLGETGSPRVEATVHVKSQVESGSLSS